MVDFGAVLTLLLALAVSTKPCPRPPCEGLDDSACAGKADWVAVGKITQVVHHPTGDPMHKDFAEFTFVPSKWEKKPKGDAPAKVEFRVGWCNNTRTVPANVAGSFRFFGAAQAGEYLDFREVK